MCAKIICDNIEKIYNTDDKNTKVYAVKSTSFTINSGEQIAIIGESGSGKSTLLSMLGGLLLPTSGKVLYDNCDIYRLNATQSAKFRRSKIGFVFQSFNLLPELTARENILLPLIMDNKKEDIDHYNYIINSLNLSDRLSHLPNKLSGGQQQRVAIARALITKPNILLCDEPTGNLDSKTSNEVISLLKDMSATTGASLVVVTHSDKIAQSFPRIITVSDGTVGGDL